MFLLRKASKAVLDGVWEAGVPPPNTAVTEDASVDLIACQAATVRHKRAMDGGRRLEFSGMSTGVTPR